MNDNNKQELAQPPKNAEDALNTLVNEALFDFDEEYKADSPPVVAAYVMYINGEIQVFYPRPETARTVQEAEEMTRADLAIEAQENAEIIAVALVTTCEIQFPGNEERQLVLSLEVENRDGYSEAVYRTYSIDNDTLVWADEIQSTEKEAEFFLESSNT